MFNVTIDGVAVGVILVYAWQYFLYLVRLPRRRRHLAQARARLSDAIESTMGRAPRDTFGDVKLPTGVDVADVCGHPPGECPLDDVVVLPQPTDPEQGRRL